MREDEKKALKVSDQASSKQRLAFLMKQADIFAHFVKASDGSGTRRRIAAALETG